MDMSDMWSDDFTDAVDNDQMVSTLRGMSCITTQKVENALRAVPRGVFVPEDRRDEAYVLKPLFGEPNVHLSSPTVYCTVLENLDLRSGDSFLNIGSGTGYLSTVCGYILGSPENGSINHGIEKFADVVEYAEERVEEFLESYDESSRICRPTFAVGNCFMLDDKQQYDRVYCGAKCPVNKMDFLISLVKVGGVLITPLRDQLVRVIRQSENKIKQEVLGEVSFSNLTLPSRQDLSQPKIVIQSMCKKSPEKRTLRLQPPNSVFLSDICAHRLMSRLRALQHAADSFHHSLPLPAAVCFISASSTNSATLSTSKDVSLLPNVLATPSPIELSPFLSERHPGVGESLQPPVVHSASVPATTEGLASIGEVEDCGSRLQQAEAVCKENSSGCDEGTVSVASTVSGIVLDHQRTLNKAVDEELWHDVVDLYYTLALSGNQRRRQECLFKLQATYDGVSGFPVHADLDNMCTLSGMRLKGWSLAHDRDLVVILSTASGNGRRGFPPVSMEWFCSDVLVRFPRLSPYSKQELAVRACVLQRVARLLNDVLPQLNSRLPSSLYGASLHGGSCEQQFDENSFSSQVNCDSAMSDYSIETWLLAPGKPLPKSWYRPRISLLHRLCFILPLCPIRTNLLTQLFRATVKDRPTRPPVVRVDRRLTSKSRSPDGSVFRQIYSGLRYRDDLNFRLRNKSRQWWEVQFVGEGIIDQGGGFRESLAEIAEELCPPRSDERAFLSLFVATPNQRVGVGEHRDCYIPNPTCTDFAAFRFVGSLMGAALRSDESFTISLPPFVWKLLVGEHICWADYSSVDEGAVVMMDAVDKADGDAFDEQYGEYLTYSITLCDGVTTVDLQASGHRQPVTFAERLSYTQLVRKARMMESLDQIEALRSGLLSVVPAEVLQLLVWHELEQKICGDPVVTPNDLQEQCRYLYDLDEQSPHVKQFWAAVSGFTSCDCSRFLRFVTGRKRLPASFWVTTSTSIEGKASSSRLPSASTCESTLYLPLYPSTAVAEDKLRYAIYNCLAIDADNRPW